MVKKDILIDEDIKDGIEKEAIEEAGIIGKTSKKSIGSYEYEKWGGKCVVEVFPCKVKTETEEWDEIALPIQHPEVPRWVPLVRLKWRYRRHAIGYNRDR